MAKIDEYIEMDNKSELEIKEESGEFEDINLKVTSSGDLHVTKLFQDSPGITVTILNCQTKQLLEFLKGWYE